jgi:hypothetical protein
MGGSLKTPVAGSRQLKTKADHLSIDFVRSGSANAGPQELHDAICTAMPLLASIGLYSILK